jgi:solute:Na+ symporter, SSS family
LSLGIIDLTVLLAYFAAVVAVGMAFARRSDGTAADYMLGGKDAPWWVILASIVATETSTVTFLSIPGFAYGRDLTWLQIALGFVIGRFVVAHLLLPGYFQGTLFTSYELLDRRFGLATGRTASILFLLTRTLADGLRLFLTALVVQEMTGLSLVLAIVATGLVTLAYCYVGGLRAVLWTDFVQLIVYLGGAVAAGVVLIDRLPGGLPGLWRDAEAAGKLRIFDFGLDFANPYGFWAGLLGGWFLTLGSHGVDQMTVQRFLAARSLRDARRALTSSGFVVFGQFALFLLIGVGLWSFYQHFPPAVAFERSDRVFARFILDELPVGLVGLLLGALFAAAMSTLSSSLNSCATVAARDFLRSSSPERELAATRWFTVAFAGAQIAVALAGQNLATSVVNAVLGIAGFSTGIVLGVFFLGRFVPRAGGREALIGIACGGVGMTTIYFATDLAWPWYSLVGSLGTLAAGALAVRLPGGAVRSA